MSFTSLTDANETPGRRSMFRIGLGAWIWVDRFGACCVCCKHAFCPRKSPAGRFFFESPTAEAVRRVRRSDAKRGRTAESVKGAREQKRKDRKEKSEQLKRKGPSDLEGDPRDRSRKKFYVCARRRARFDARTPHRIFTAKCPCLHGCCRYWRMICRRFQP